MFDLEAFIPIGAPVVLSKKPSENTTDPYMFLIIGNTVITVQFNFTYSEANGYSISALTNNSITAKVSSYNIFMANTNQTLVTKRYSGKGVLTRVAIGDAYNDLKEMYNSLKQILDDDIQMKYVVKSYHCSNE